MRDLERDRIARLVIHDIGGSPQRREIWRAPCSNYRSEKSGFCAWREKARLRSNIAGGRGGGGAQTGPPLAVFS